MVKSFNSNYSTVNFLTSIRPEQNPYENMTLKEFREFMSSQPEEMKADDYIKEALVHEALGMEEQSLISYENAALMGSCYAMFMAGVDAFISGSRVPAEYKNKVKNGFPKAFKYFSYSAEKGFVFSMYFLATMYAEGFGCRRSVKKANEWLQTALENDEDGVLFEFLKRNMSKTEEESYPEEVQTESKDEIPSENGLKKLFNPEDEHALPGFVMGDIINHDLFYAKTYCNLPDYFLFRSTLPTKYEVREMIESEINDNLEELEYKLDEGEDASESLSQVIFYRDLAQELFDDFDGSEVDWAADEAFEKQPELESIVNSNYVDVSTDWIEDAMKEGKNIIDMV